MLKAIKHFKLPLFARVVVLYVVTASLAAGLLYVTRDTAVEQFVPPAVSVGTVKKADKNYVEGDPIRIIASRQGIDLTIVGGHYDNESGAWTLTNDKAQFAEVTSLPNNSTGNTFIYGHNTEVVFAKFRDIKKGDQVKVQTKQGHTFVYSYTGRISVQPDNASVLSDTKEPTLTLMTCEGVFSQTRRVMYFSLVGVA